MALVTADPFTKTVVRLTVAPRSAWVESEQLEMTEVAQNS